MYARWILRILYPSNLTRITGDVIAFHVPLHNETQKTTRRNSVVYNFAKKGVGSLVCLPPPCINRVDHPLSRPGSRISFSTFGCNKRRADVQASIQNPHKTRNDPLMLKGWCGDESKGALSAVCKCCCDQTYFFLFFYFCNSNSCCPFSIVPPPPTHNSTPFHDVHIAACMSLNHRDWRQPHRSGRCPLLPIYAYAYFYFDLESPETIWWPSTWNPVVLLYATLSL